MAPFGYRFIHTRAFSYVLIASIFVYTRVRFIYAERIVRVRRFESAGHGSTFDELSTGIFGVSNGFLRVDPLPLSMRNKKDKRDRAIDRESILFGRVPPGTLKRNEFVERKLKRSPDAYLPSNLSIGFQTSSNDSSPTHG